MRNGTINPWVIFPYLPVKYIFFFISGTFHVDNTSSPQMASQVLPLPTVPLVSDTPSSENERSIALSDFAVQTSSDRLKVAVEDAKLGSKR